MNECKPLLLGDRLWALDTPFAEVAAYFPAPLLALRTLKVAAYTRPLLDYTEAVLATDSTKSTTRKVLASSRKVDEC